LKIKGQIMFKDIVNNVFDKAKDSLESFIQEDAKSTSASKVDSKASQELKVELDPDTLHGTHYSIEEFKAEVENRVDAWIKSQNDTQDELSQGDIKNIRHIIQKDLYKEWTGANSDQVTQWDLANSIDNYGYASTGFAKDDSTNPLLEPIHGISLEDYAAISFKISQGFDEESVAKIFGIDSVVFAEVNTLWVKRMQEDETFLITTLFGQYFGTAPSHPKLSGLQIQISESAKANLERLKTDRYFYEELCGARIAAHQYGIDGAQWILDNYEITLGDFQAVASEYAKIRNQQWSSEEITHFSTYQSDKRDEYAKRFAAEQGGNVADDIEF
jgi:hypothetical protein